MLSVSIVRKIEKREWKQKKIEEEREKNNNIRFSSKIF